MNPPVVKVIIESMRHEIANAMFLHTDEIKKSIDAELKKAVDNFDFESEMRAEANSMIAATCQEIVRDTMQAIRYDMRFKERVRNMVLEALAKEDEER